METVDGGGKSVGPHAQEGVRKCFARYCAAVTAVSADCWRMLALIPRIAPSCDQSLGRTLNSLTQAGTRAHGMLGRRMTRVQL